MNRTISADRGAQAAKPGTNDERIDYAVKGECGLRLRVSARKDGGVNKIWSLLYTRKSDNKKCRLTLGEYPAMSLAEARQVAGRHRNAVREGADPAQTRREEKKADTFVDLAGEWLTRHAKLKKRSWREDERMLNHDILPVIGAMKIEMVKTADIVTVVDAVADRGASYQANRVLVLVRTIFNWGFKRGKVEVNPAARVEKPGSETGRMRALSPDEVRQFWLGLDQVSLSPQMRIVFRLSLLLGQRLNELVLARKSEFDLEARRWDIPGTRAMPRGRKDSGAKNKRNHPLPLSDHAVSLLHEAFVLSGDSEWLFPSPVHENEPVGFTAAPRAWGRVRRELGLDDVQARDLRRSFATVAGWCGFLNAQIGLVLNHVWSAENQTAAAIEKHGQQKITTVYNRAEYLPEKRAVIEAVGERVLAFIEGDDVEANIMQQGERLEDQN